MKKLLIVAGAIASSLIANGEARAANCATLTFTSGPNTVTGWNPLTGSNGSATFTVTATRVTTGGIVRSARIIFPDNETEVTMIGQTGPNYDILDPAQSVVSAPSGTPVPTSSTGAQFSWGNSSNSNDTSASVTFSIRVLPSATRDYAAGTTYAEALRYSIQCFSSNGLLGLDSNVSTGKSLSLLVPSLVAFNTASPQTINFGNFSTNTQNLSIGVKSTSSINVSVTTTNGNQMVLSGASTPFPENGKIPYTMTLNSDAIVSGSSLTNRTRAGVAGTSWPLVLTLTGGVPSGKIAGSYSDTITLTLSPGT